MTRLPFELQAVLWHLALRNGSKRPKMGLLVPVEVR
jgi:hypothetical protein